MGVIEAALDAASSWEEACGRSSAPGEGCLPCRWRTVSEGRARLLGFFGQCSRQEGRDSHHPWGRSCGAQGHLGFGRNCADTGEGEETHDRANREASAVLFVKKALSLFGTRRWGVPSLLFY